MINSLSTVGATAAINSAILIPIIGQPLYVVAAALVGTISGFAFSNGQESRKILFLTSFACVAIGCASTSILPDLLGWQWYEVKKHASPMAVMTSLVSRWMVPMFIKKMDQFMDRLLSLNSNKGE